MGTKRTILKNDLSSKNQFRIFLRNTTCALKCGLIIRPLLIHAKNEAFLRFTLGVKKLGKSFKIMGEIVCCVMLHRHRSAVAGSYLSFRVRIGLGSSSIPLAATATARLAAASLLAPQQSPPYCSFPGQNMRAKKSQFC